jgi:hypothetical protein
MSITLCKLEAMLPIKFLEKGLMSCYSMIIAKALETAFELSNANVKLKVLNNRYNGQIVGFMVSGNVKDNF